MKKLYLLGILLFFLGGATYGQQDAMFTKYMFNTLSYNPAYAGSMGYMSTRLIHRHQWWGIEGAPVTQAFTIHAPMNEKVGLGLSVVNDAIGPVNTVSANASYAYHLILGDGNAGKISIGVQGGVTYWGADWSKLTIRDPNDNSYSEMRPSLWLPNVGAGIYYYTDYFYAGVSVPHIINYDLRDNVEAETDWARTYRHYFFTAGGAIPINANLVFKPSILIKNVGLFGEFNSNPATINPVSAPTEFDIDVSILMFETLWIGASFRSAFEAFRKDNNGNAVSSMDSADVWAAYYLKNGLRIGLAYDFTLTKLQEHADGSFELMVGYDFDFRKKKIVTPRYF